MLDLIKSVCNVHYVTCLQTCIFVLFIMSEAVPYYLGQGARDYDSVSSSRFPYTVKAYAIDPDTLFEHRLSFSQDSITGTSQEPPSSQAFSKEISTPGAEDKILNSELRQEKLTVLDFYATPNDGKGDSGAFMNAIKHASNVTGVVFIPSGTYVIDKLLRIPSNMTIEGEDRERTILVGNYTSDTSLPKDVIGVRGEPDKPLSNVTIANLTVHGSGANTMGNCIDLKRVKNYTVVNTMLSGCGSGPDGAAVYTRETSDGKIINNVINKSRNGYLSAQHRGGSDNVLIANNTISNSVDDAIHPQNGSFNKIIDNIVSNSGDDSIDLFYENNTIVENNIIIMNDNSTHINGLEVGDGSSNILIRNNIVNGGLANGINVGSDTIRFDPTLISNNITIVGNNIDNTYENCIRVSQAYDIEILNNKLEKCNNVRESPSHGILLANTARDVSIENNSIAYYGGSLSVGIAIDNAYNIEIVSNILVTDPINRLYGTGILIGTLSSNIIIENNDLNGCGCTIKNKSFQQDISIKNNNDRI
jgi:parallel beta-helix repeat protein